MTTKDFPGTLESALQKGRDPKRGLVKPQGHNTSIVSGKVTFSDPMTPKQWIDSTKIDYKIRSSKLKKFDDAYKQYCQRKSVETMMEAQLHLSCWMRSKTDKHGDWKKSSRNKNYAPEIVYQQLFRGFARSSNGLPLWLPHLQGTEEQQAMAFWVQQSQNLCQRYFTAGSGQRLHLSLKKMETAKQTGLAVKKLANEIKSTLPPLPSPSIPSVSIPTPSLSLTLPNTSLPNINVPNIKLPGMDLPNVNLPQFNLPSTNLPGLNLPNFNFPDAPRIMVSLQNMIANFFGFASFNLMAEFSFEIMSLIKFELGGIIGNFIADMIPIVAQIKGGAEVLAGWGKVAYSYYSDRSARTHGIYFNTGDAAKAFNAVMTLMKRETKALAAAATTITAKFSADMASAGTLTPITGLTKTLADVAQKLFLLGLQWNEARAVNKILANNDTPLGFEIFKTAPITGSYLVAHASLGDLLSMGRYLFGAPGWKEKVTQLDKKHIQPMRKVAKKQIDKSIFSIPNFPHTKLIS